MGITRAHFCDNSEDCSRLGAEGYIDHWIGLPARDLEFCSVACAMEWAHLGPMWHGMADDRAAIEAAVNERVSFDPAERAALDRWRKTHSPFCEVCEREAAAISTEVQED